MKMSKKNYNKTILKKMEIIALRLLNFNQKQRNIKNKSKYLKDNIKTNYFKEMYIKETKKDTLTVDFNKIMTYKNKSFSGNININKENYMNNYTNYLSLNSTDELYCENMVNMLKNEKEEKRRNKSRISKEKKIVPKIKDLDLIIKDKINKLNHKPKEEESSLTIDNTSLNLSLEFNYDILDKIKNIYTQLIKEFEKIHSINNINNSRNDNFIDNENLKKIYFKCRVLARDYYAAFLFGEEIKKIFFLFNYCSDVGKFIIYQIYLFLSLINLDENIIMENSLEMSYRTIILYSSQNFNILSGLIQNPILSSEPKYMNNIKTKNKIIISVLKLIYPNLPSKEKIKEFINKDIINIGKLPVNIIEDIEKKGNNIKSVKDSKDVNENNSIGILNLINSLKQNKKLKEKLIQIQKIVLNNYDINLNLNNINNNINSNANNNHFSLKISNNINFNYNNNINNNLNLVNTNSNKYLLPILNTEDLKNYKFFLFFELDETLVHYWEETDYSYVKIRWGVEDCFSQIFDFCEISIISTSSTEYTEKIVERFNQKGNFIKNKIYKEDDDENFDLSNINRDMNKCIFICHEEEFFNAPKNNILTLTEFQGDEHDREMLFLCKELMKLKKENIDHVMQIIPNMMLNIRI